MVYKKPESVLVVLYDQHHNVLLLQRDDDPNFWQSVTGAMEEGEQPIDTAYREVYEETGINLKQLGLSITDCKTTNQYEIRQRWRHRYPPGTRFNTEHVFAVQIDSDFSIELTEHLAYHWVTKTEAIERLWSSTNREAVTMFVPSQA